MRPQVRSIPSSAPAFFALFALGGLAACATLSGLDQIQVSDCAPDGCPDASAAGTQPSSFGPPDSAVAAGEGGATGEPTGSDAEAGPARGGDDASAGGDATATDADLGEDGADADPSADAGRDAGALADASALDAGADATAPHDAGATQDAGSCGTVYFEDAFGDNAKGWTLDPNWTIAKECASPPAPQKGNPDPTTDHSGTAASGVVGAFVCGNNPIGQTTPFYYATSPAVDTSSAATLKLDFWRWLNTDASDWFASTIDVYNGTKWVNVYTNPSGAGNLVTDASWTHEDIDVTAEKNAAFRVRFGYSIANTSAYAMSAWNVDDVSISSATCN